MVNYCYLPGDEHSHDSSYEHIFPESIGGRLKVRGLLCAKHNNIFGYTIDSGLEKALRPYCVLLGLTQLAGHDPKYFELEVGERKIRIDSNGGKRISQPKFEKRLDPITGKTEIKIEAPDDEYLEVLLKQFAKKNPKLNIDVNQVEKLKIELDTKEYQPKIEIPFNNKNVYRSIYKTLVNYWIAKGQSVEYIYSLISALIDISPILTAPYYGTEILNGKVGPTIANSLVIVGSQKHKRLIGYVELLDAFRFIIQINSEYLGPDIELSLFENVLSDEVLDNLTVNSEALFTFEHYNQSIKQPDSNVFKGNFDRLYFNIVKISEFNGILNSALDAAAAEYANTNDRKKYFDTLSSHLTESFVRKLFEGDTPAEATVD
ncbi:hypothetical protein CH373_18205 [Leptospira perolatii]|uniref:HNH endonuclease 5 domain-containing protein n=1 Tax=Leptospira perolatii TaxID=2023191 RepID=A0A2M9ZI34_9LEPT|nr:HNH endonuclease [Leptospira perolatii]PJZ68029.1 hypothetical protein CH360_18285 [Leptospira perolatii]PJZ71692.1 hypothetical protein CH373_18205 [Leptospira perolatii]